MCYFCETKNTFCGEAYVWKSHRLGLRFDIIYLAIAIGDANGDGNKYTIFDDDNKNLFMLCIRQQRVPKIELNSRILVNVSTKNL